jgi:hypothetical protein
MILAFLELRLPIPVETDDQRWNCLLFSRVISLSFE